MSELQNVYNSANNIAVDYLFSSIPVITDAINHLTEDFIDSRVDSKGHYGL